MRLTSHSVQKKWKMWRRKNSDIGVVDPENVSIGNWGYETKVPHLPTEA